MYSGASITRVVLVARNSWHEFVTLMRIELNTKFYSILFDLKVNIIVVLVVYVHPLI